MLVRHNSIETDEHGTGAKIIRRRGRTAAHRKLNKLPALKQAILVAVERIL